MQVIPFHNQYLPYTDLLFFTLFKENETIQYTIYHTIFSQTYHSIYYIEMAVVIERGGIRYRKTSVEVREDLHEYARVNGINMAGLLNKALEEKRKGGK